ncbi:hypothetical protein B0T16DRAFT_203696 [Cercophora newfieldiana]|uniref:Secreted protein n=1 Tax=Cercophora newfieldiana TaxID=92897 RepID=A0AA39XV89_9PEZI|nr:hypothetical protein B0T16DRAFT_203696 [Cercophora newfieldiana]
MHRVSPILSILLLSLIKGYQIFPTICALQSSTFSKADTRYVCTPAPNASLPPPYGYIAMISSQTDRSARKNTTCASQTPCATACLCVLYRRKDKRNGQEWCREHA